MRHHVLARTVLNRQERKPIRHPATDPDSYIYNLVYQYSFPDLVSIFNLHWEKGDDCRDIVLAMTSLLIQKCHVTLHQKQRITEGRKRAKVIRPKAMMMIDKLSTALWIQGAIAIIEGHQFTRCAECNRFMRVKKLREFCSGNCRVTRHQKRKAESQKQYSLGKNVADIARTLGIDDPDLVQGWVQPGR